MKIIGNNLEKMARQNRQLPKHKRLTQADMAIDDYLSDLLTICLSFFVV